MHTQKNQIKGYLKKVEERSPLYYDSQEMALVKLSSALQEVNINVTK